MTANVALTDTFGDFKDKSNEVIVMTQVDGMSNFIKLLDTTQSTSNTTGSIITAGGVGIAKNVTIGGSVNVHGNLHANGAISADGDLTLGDAATDNIVFAADVNSHIIPNTDDTYDLGSTGQQWRNLYLNGTANLDIVDIDGAVQIDGAITVGVDGTGLDVKFFGDTPGSFMLWDQSDDALELTDASPIRIGDDAAGDMTLYHDGTNSYITNKTGALKLATETSGIVVTIGHTTSEVTVADNLTVTGDLTVSGATTTLTTATIALYDKNIEIGNVGSPSDTTADGGGLTLKGASDKTITWTNSLDSWVYNQGITVGLDGTGYDVTFYGATSGAYMRWDENVDDLLLVGDARAVIPDGQLVLGSTAVTSTATELNLLDGVSGLVQADLTKLAAIDSSAAELNLLDGVSGLVKADLTKLAAIDSSAAEVNLIDGSSAGTIVNSKAVVYGSSGQVNGTTLQIAGSSITSSAAELNLLDGVAGLVQADFTKLAAVTQSAAEINAHTSPGDVMALAIALG